MKILVRADSSATIGTGHIMRDLVLVKEFKDSNITFATQNLEGNINHKIEESGYDLKILDSNDIEELDSLVKSLKIDFLVIDHYGIDCNFEKELKIKNPNLKIMALDDTYEKHYCDILLNHNIYAKAEKYKNLVPKWCEIRCGEQFTLLRDEFLREKKIKREKVYDFLIALGGTDSANLNIKVLETILDISLDSRIVVVTTTANSNLDKLKEFSKKYSNISLEINSNSMAKLINQSRLAIITPSVTANEVYFLSVPIVAILVAENQEYMGEFLAQKGYPLIRDFNREVFKDILWKILN